jgi:hypothetical protein
MEGTVALKFTRIEYDKLTARQKENYNFAKLSAVLADFGFMTLRLSDDWQGADLIAQSLNLDFIKIQVKGRLSFDVKYQGKDIYVAFRSDGDWYLYPHDEVLTRVLTETNVAKTDSLDASRRIHLPFVESTNENNSRAVQDSRLTHG